MNKDFFASYVLGWIRADLGNMRSISPDSNSGNLSFPLALCILNYMEVLGSYLIGGNNGFEANVRTYIKDCFSKEHQDEYIPKILGKIFRHALAHEYFSRAIVSRNGLRPAMRKIAGGGVILDVEILMEDFLPSLNEFVRVLDEGKFKIRANAFEKSLEKELKNCSAAIESLPIDDSSVLGVRTSTHPGEIRLGKASSN